MENTSQPASLFDRTAVPGSSLRWEHILWIVLLLAAAVTRFAMLDTRVMSHDEGQHTQLAWYLSQGAGYSHDPMTHGPFQIETVASMYLLLGGSDWASRLPAAAFGVAAVALLWLFRRWLGRGGALAAALLMTISPYMMYYARYVRNESFVVVWALLMFYAVGRFVESRQSRWLYLLAAATALHYATKETAYIYVGLMIIFLVGLLQYQIQRGSGIDPKAKRRYILLFTAGAAVALAAVVVLLLGRSDVMEAARLAGVTQLPDQMLHTEMPITNWLIQCGLIILVGAFGLLTTAVVVLLRARPLSNLREQFPIIDALVILVTFLLPQIAALPMALFNLNPWDGNPLTRMQNLGYDAAVVLCFLPGLIAAVAIGLAWDRRKWLACAGIFFGIYVVLYTTFFTNIMGLATGMIGNVNYWMAQQGVQRGSQPWYYYILIQIPMYEYLPALLALCASFAGLAAWWKRRRPAPVAEDAVPPAESAGNPETFHVFPMVWLLGFWSIGSLLAYTAAGEKMPWLTVHITLPFILLGGWMLGRVVEGLRERRLFAWPGILGWFLLPASLLSFLLALAAWQEPVRPFSGSAMDAISASSNFLFSLLIALGGIFLAGWLWRGIRAGAAVRAVFLAVVGLLAACTFRAAWMASFINYDLATEFLVYAHSAPGVKVVLSQAEEISRLTKDDLSMPVAYDDHVGWIMTWYMRDFTSRQNFGTTIPRKLGETFIEDFPMVIVGPNNFAAADQMLLGTHDAFTYIRGWWPMMDYFGLTADRILNALESPDYRRGLWDIWWNRDYTAYGKASGGDFTLSHWPVAEPMRLYLRKDLAPKVWSYSSTAVLPEPVKDPYAQNVLPLAAIQVWGQAGTEPGQFADPRAVAVAPDRTVYVSDTGNNRIQHFAPDGSLLGVWGSTSLAVAGSEPPGGTFNEPWGIDTGPDGAVYVADTWNNRIQKFSSDGKFLAAWGHSGSGDDQFGFYGPRGVAVDPQGRVFVADTGNKRIMIYDADGGYLAQIGGAGFDAGQFDEPVGLAFAPDGRLYVADTWNRRMQVFVETGGVFQYQTEWAIDSWSAEKPDVKPFLAVAPDGKVWASDPGSARILVFDSEGAFQFSFGAAGSDASSFQQPTGLAVGTDGAIYIADTLNNRVMIFGQP